MAAVPKTRKSRSARNLAGDKRKRNKERASEDRLVSSYTVTRKQGGKTRSRTKYRGYTSGKRRSGSPKGRSRH